MKSLVFGILFLFASTLHAQCGSSTGCNLASSCGAIFASMGCGQSGAYVSQSGECAAGYQAVDCNTGAALASSGCGQASSGCGQVASGCGSDISSGCGASASSGCGQSSSGCGSAASSGCGSSASSGCSASSTTRTKVRTGWYLGKFIGR